MYSCPVWPVCRACRTLVHGAPAASPSRIDRVPLSSILWLLCTTRSRIASASVGQRRVVEVGVPGFDRQLAGDQGRARADAVVQQFEQVVALRWPHGGDRKIVDHDQVELGQCGKPPREAAVAVRDLQFVEQSCRAHVQHREPAARGLMRQCTRQPRLARARRLRDILPANTSFVRFRFTIPTTRGPGLSLVSLARFASVMNAS